ncbi:hypothetical protein RRG08_050481 [Elysia crispata]|uniref:Uncharacterized protein n=1 Tax=Elysia crispata TaxID=231223 RepID=A0AAE0YAZ0_9GAST|nr:hypothetical protein RRG08_050481 [Elysia crispata]
MTSRPADKRLRHLYAVWAFLEIAGFGGVIFGWGSLVFVLKEENLYGNLCGNGTGNDSSAKHSDNLSNMTCKYILQPLANIEYY